MFRGMSYVARGRENLPYGYDYDYDSIQILDLGVFPKLRYLRNASAFAFLILKIGVVVIHVTGFLNVPFRQRDYTSKVSKKFEVLDRRF